MKLNLSSSTSEKSRNRLKKKIRIRKVVFGSKERPRLCVFRSGRHIYGQIINDDMHSTVLASSSLALGLKNGSKDNAKAVGAKIAELAKAAGITNVVFDRNGYIYHGRVQALADGARSAGLNF